ncbi:MFS transporter [Acuticoccus sp. M5D2P5]|uniref:MFS transporter n=1 Tax=Acuticoccus kalidii TaxID=2910977 RepID=UPI001F33A5BC|nr:MFS transporter [Acuticoccus kalidii]MCF3933010.1 MFS transporter [Acuticoccus kalidii]
MAMPIEGEAPARGRWRALLILCTAVVAALTTWFSATAITPELARAFDLSPSMLAWLTNGVQLGFVAGAIGASLVNLPDIVRLNRLMGAAALVAAAANAAMLIAPSPLALILARIVTGAALAAVYPPAMKLVATWFVSGRGFALGAIISAITLGSALPHLVRALSTALEWHVVVASTSGAALLAALIFFLFAREGPYPFGRAVFDPRQIGAVFRDRPLRLAIFGYLGHMWELYGAWAWLLVYARVALAAQGEDAAAASFLTFAMIGAGAVGCLLGGVLSDRIGRTATTAGMMIVSGLCALSIGFAFTGPVWLFVAIALVWGVTIVGDSAQFSAAVTELADRRYVGTALSIQVGLGFALTVFTIWLLPEIAIRFGSWQWVFLILAIGPAFGAYSMLRLRRDPDSLRLAGGLR